MLRISYENSPQGIVLKLEGGLAGPWVDEVARTWMETIGDRPSKQVTVDLSEVIFVDAEGKKLLRWMFVRGAKLSRGHLMTKYIVDQVVKEVSSLDNREGDPHALGLPFGARR